MEVDLDLDLDLNRLHAVLTGQIGGRGCGKTFALCQLIVGYIELGHMNIMWPVREHNHRHHKVQMLGDILYGYGIKLRQKKYDITIWYADLPWGVVTIHMPTSSPIEELGRRGYPGLLVPMEIMDGRDDSPMWDGDDKWL